MSKEYYILIFIILAIVWFIASINLLLNIKYKRDCAGKICKDCGGRLDWSDLDD